MKRETGHMTLGDNVVPVNYSLAFEPDFKTFKFNGSAVISVEIKRPTKTVKLNFKELQIKKAVVRSGTAEQQAAVSLDKKNEELTLTFKNPIHGAATLSIDFIGTHNDGMYGFYRSKYTHNNRTLYIMTTQFEAPNARAAFPCFDEPEFKATFEVSMIVDGKRDAISNMPVRSTKRTKGGKKIVAFQKTPRMSSYLLYLGVGEFEYLHGRSGRTKLRVITTPGKKKYAKMPLEYCAKLLAAQEKYFGIRFALPKLDLIAVPDFSSGAMENWGAITFREAQFLGDEKSSSVGVKQSIASTISHELVHQWFGDLVTMKWWDDIWLNESFATFMGDRIADQVFPEWKLMVRYFQDTFASAYAVDSLKSTHPINVKVNTAGEIGSVFDQISYEKGGSVLYMLEDFVGGDVFRKGLHRYLKENAFGNAEKSALWNAIQQEAKASGLKAPVAALMEAWVDQPGYPIVSVKKDGDSYTLEQNRYSLLDQKLPGVWLIPVKYRSESSERRAVMREKRMVLHDSGSWIKLNHSQSGFYRVSYDDSMLRRLGEIIDAKELSDIDIWGIESDLFAMARGSRIPADVYLDFVGRHLMNCSYPTTLAVSGHLLWMLDMGEGRSKNLESRVRRLSIAFNRGLLSRLGWSAKPGESSIDTKTRVAVIAALGSSDDTETINTAVRMFDEFTAGKADIDTNLRVAVYRIAARAKNDAKTYDYFMDRYNEHNLIPEEKIKSLVALPVFRNEKLLERALDDALSSRIRRQDSVYMISDVPENLEGRELFFDWARRNWKKLMGIYDPGAHKLDIVVSSMSGYADREHLDAIKSFFKDRSNIRDDIKREVSKTLEYVEANIRFVELNR